MAASKEFPVEFFIKSWSERRLYDGKQEKVYRVYDDAEEFVAYTTTSEKEAWAALKIRAELLLKEGYDVDLPPSTPVEIVNYLAKTADVVEVSRNIKGRKSP